MTQTDYSTSEHRELDFGSGSIEEDIANESPTSTETSGGSYPPHVSHYQLGFNLANIDGSLLSEKGLAFIKPDKLSPSKQEVWSRLCEHAGKVYDFVSQREPGKPDIESGPRESIRVVEACANELNLPLLREEFGRLKFSRTEFIPAFGVAVDQGSPPSTGRHAEQDTSPSDTSLNRARAIGPLSSGGKPKKAQELSLEQITSDATILQPKSPERIESQPKQDKDKQRDPREHPQGSAPASQADMSSSSSDRDETGKRRAEQQEKPELNAFIREEFKNQKYISNIYGLYKVITSYKSRHTDDERVTNIFNHASKLNKGRDYDSAIDGLVAEIPYMKDNLMEFMFHGEEPFKKFVDAIEEIESRYNAQWT